MKDNYLNLERLSQFTDKLKNIFATKKEVSDHVHPEQINVKGNAGTATKLETSRSITLTGDIVGSATFDGSKDISITTEMRGCSVGVGNVTLENGLIWKKVAEMDITKLSYITQIVFLCNFAVANDTDGDVGIFRIDCRTASAKDSEGKFQLNQDEFQWMVLGKQSLLTKDKFALMYKAGENSIKLELYVKFTNNYQGFNFEVLSENSFIGRQNEWTLFNSTESPLTSLPTDYTAIQMKDASSVFDTVLTSHLEGVTAKDIGGLPSPKRLFSEDLNTVLDPGFYYAGGGNTCAHKPPNVGSTTNFGLIVIRTAVGNITQIYVYSTTINNSIEERMFSRSAASGVFSDWNVLVNTGEARSRGCVVRNKGGGDNTKPWRKFAEGVLSSESVGGYNITFYVSKISLNVDDRNTPDTGILTVSFGTTHVDDNGVFTIDKAGIQWDYITNSGNGEIEPENFALIYNTTGSSTSTAKFELWCSIPDSYVSYGFDVISERGSNSRNIFWNLLSEDTVTGVASPTMDGTFETLYGVCSYPQRLKMNDGVYDHNAIILYNADAVNNIGAEMDITGGGNTFIGSGEAPHNLHSALQSGSKLTGEVYMKSGEGLYLASDGEVLFYSNANTIANRKGFKFTTDGSLSPIGGTNINSIGRSGNVWKDVYAKTFHGRLDGSATSAAYANTLLNFNIFGNNNSGGWYKVAYFDFGGIPSDFYDTFQSVSIRFDSVHDAYTYGELRIAAYIDTEGYPIDVYATWLYRSKDALNYFDVAVLRYGSAGSYNVEVWIRTNTFDYIRCELRMNSDAFSTYPSAWTIVSPPSNLPGDSAISKDLPSTIDGYSVERLPINEPLLQSGITNLSDIYSLYDNIGIPMEMRRNIYRGKNLGNSYTDEQKAEIAAGTFKDLFIGDYWKINDVVWRIVDINYWLNTGDIKLTKPHLVIMPDQSLYSTVFNSSATTSGGYVGSTLYTLGLEDAKSRIKSAFGSDYILKHKEYLVNSVTDGVPTGAVWTYSDVEIPNEYMIFGNSLIGSKKSNISSAGNSVNYDAGIDNTQLSLMRLYPYFIVANSAYWLRDAVNEYNFGFVMSNRVIFGGSANVARHIRPVFGIIGD